MGLSVEVLARAMLDITEVVTEPSEVVRVVLEMADVGVGGRTVGVIGMGGVGGVSVGGGGEILELRVGEISIV
jgi:hypothetical protein